MSMAVATIEAAGVAVDHQAILKSLNLNPRDPNTQALLLVCERYGLDPLLKHMVLIQGSPYITRDGYLAIAHRSGVFDGMEVLEQGSDQTHFTAKVAVYRKDMGRPFTFIGRYPKAQRMAKEYGPEMAVKVAEVQALRRAFNVTGVGAADERWDEDAVERTHAEPAAKPELAPVPAERPSNKEYAPAPKSSEEDAPPSTGPRKRKPPTAVKAEVVDPPAASGPLASDEDREAIALLLKQYALDPENRTLLMEEWNQAKITSFKAAERFTAADAEAAFALLADFQVQHPPTRSPLVDE